MYPNSPFSSERLFFAISLLGFLGRLFLCLVGKLGFASFGGGKFGLEAVDTTFGVDDLFLTSEEWVRCGRNMDFHQWVGVAVFPFDSFVGRCRALGQKRETGHIVAKYDRAVVGWVYTAFHNLLIVAVRGRKVKGEDCYYLCLRSLRAIR